MTIPLTSKDKTNYRKMDKKSLVYAFINLCGDGHLSHIQHLLENNVLTPKRLRISLCIERGLKESCTHGHTHIVHYLLHDFSSSYQANVNHNGGEFLMYAATFQHENIIRQLILEYKIEINDRIKENIKDNLYVQHIFQLRELQTQLQDMPITESSKNKPYLTLTKNKI